MPLLNLENIDASYGSAQALKGVNLAIEVKELLTILGANGSGKSTILKVISGILKPKAGKVEFQGNRIDHLSTDAIVKLGISQSPEGRRLFPELSVLKNLSLGAYVRRKDKADMQKAMSEVFDLFPVLRNRPHQLAGTLSGGEQQMLAIGRALMSTPKLLLLDEPSLGLAPLVVSRIFETIQRINANGTAICLVEQNAAMAITIAHRGYVLESGRVVLTGTREVLRSDEKIRQAYLGI
jgi:branched-chain amino acid transport system ATP-binding protein